MLLFRLVKSWLVWNIYILVSCICKHLNCNQDAAVRITLGFRCCLSRQRLRCPSKAAWSKLQPNFTLEFLAFCWIIPAGKETGEGISCLHSWVSTIWGNYFFFKAHECMSVTQEFMSECGNACLNVGRIQRSPKHSPGHSTSSLSQQPGLYFLLFLNAGLVTLESRWWKVFILASSLFHGNSIFITSHTFLHRKKNTLKCSP